MANVHLGVKVLDAIDGTGLTEAERREMLKAANRLIRRLEPPFETMLQHLAIPNATAALQTLYDLDLFDKWAEIGLDKPATVDKLSALTGCDPELLVQLLRHLVSVGYLGIIDADTFQTNAISKLFVEKGFRDWMPFLSELSLPGILQIPKFLKRTNYKNATDANDNPFTDCNNGLKVFDILAGSPELASNFNEVMKISNYTYSVSWIDLYPTEELVGTDGVILVDVGGNQGQDIKKLADKYDLPDGSLVLQDLRAGLADAELPASVTPMEHDFFTPQPIKGAKAYYLHRVFHDWPDADVLRILEQLRDAMTSNHSRILVHEQTVHADNPSWYNTTSDLLLLAAVASRERTNISWNQLAESVGLRVSRVFSATSDSIFEMVLA